MIKGSVDRLEDDWIIIVPDSGPIFQIPKLLFPDLKEGDIVSINMEREESEKIKANTRIDEIKKGLNRIKL